MNTVSPSINFRGISYEIIRQKLKENLFLLKIISSQNSLPWDAMKGNHTNGFLKMLCSSVELGLTVTIKYIVQGAICDSGRPQALAWQTSQENMRESTFLVQLIFFSKLLLLATTTEKIKRWMSLCSDSVLLFLQHFDLLTYLEPALGLFGKISPNNSFQGRRKAENSAFLHHFHSSFYHLHSQ